MYKNTVIESNGASSAESKRATSRSLFRGQTGNEGAPGGSGPQPRSASADPSCKKKRLSFKQKLPVANQLTRAAKNFGSGLSSLARNLSSLPPSPPPINKSSKSFDSEKLIDDTKSRSKKPNFS